MVTRPTRIVPADGLNTKTFKFKAMWSHGCSALMRRYSFPFSSFISEYDTGIPSKSYAIHDTVS